MLKAIFSPGPSYSNPEVRKVAGWVRILDMYKVALEELGYEVFVPDVDSRLIDDRSTVSKIVSYDLVAAAQLPEDADLFLGPPGYSLAQMMKLKGRKGLRYEPVGGPAGVIPLSASPHLFLYCWNNADWWRDQQLAREYARLGYFYDLAPTWRWINLQALHLADTVIACSPWVAWSHARALGSGEKVVINPWGVDAERFAPKPTEAPLVDDPLKIVFVGSDPVRKGLVYLFEALDDLPNTFLRMVGTDELPHYLWEPRWDKVWRVNMGMEPVERMPAMMRGNHVICIPTLEDGIACALQEGMAVGLVPIATPEAAEVFKDSMFNQGIEGAGIEVPYRDSAALRQAIVTLRDNRALLNDMSTKAKRMAELQTWDKTKESLKVIIRERCK